VGLGATEDGLVDFAIWVLGQHRAQRAVGADGAAAVADGKEAALEAIFVFDEMLWPFDELAARRTGAQHLGEVLVAENIAEKGLGVAGHPAIALRDGAFGVDGDELVGTVLLPDARQPRRRTGEVMNEGIEGTQGDAVGMAALHPYVEEAGEEFGERRLIEIEFGFDYFSGSAGERRVDLKALESEFLGVIAVESVGAGVEAALVEHGDDANTKPGGLGFAKPLGPDRGVGLGAAAEKLSMEIREIHRSAKGPAEHRVQHIIPGGRVADQIRLEVMGEASSARGGGFVHDPSSLHKPGRTHDHRLAALPVDFTFLDAFEFDVVEKLPRE